MRFIITAALAVCLSTSVHAADPKPDFGNPAGPTCMTANVAAANARDHGAVMARLDGDDADSFLLAFNAEGEPTAYHAATVIVLLFPDHAAVALFDICHTENVMMPLEPFERVWFAARGVRV